ncbi:MAG: NAD(P)-binding domain-containing protein [Methanobrevibacter sp.]|jgi:pyrroline-5-carboxylate reductase|nr:NAD(P)-binding domain-containing protein [Methanobrevibacter sp.]
MENRKKLGFIGYGNIGKLVINNILSLNLFDFKNIIVSNRNLSKLNLLIEKYPDVTVTSDNKFLAIESDIIFIFIGTGDVKNLLEEIKPYLNENTYLIHSAAALSFQMISKIYNGKVSQVIPSMASKSESDLEKLSNLKRLNDLDEVLELNREKHGVSLIAHNELVEEDNKEFLEDLFSSFSDIKVLGRENLENERNMEVATILSSCGPALISIFIKNLVKLSNSYCNLEKEELENILIKTVKSTTTQLDENNQTIDEIIRNTATKGGITQVGLDYIQNNNHVIDVMLKELFKTYNEKIAILNKQYGL